MIEYHSLIMPYVLCLIITAYAGWIALHLCIPKAAAVFSAAERTALSYLIGLGAITLEMFYFSIAGIKWNLAFLLAPWIPFAVLCGSRRGGREPCTHPCRTPISPAEKALILCMAVQAGLVIFEALIKPIYSFDAIANFSLQAKVFYLNKGIPFDLLYNAEAISHPARPYFLQMAEAWVYLFIGSWADIFAKALMPLFYLCFIVLFYGAVRRFEGRFTALAFTFMLFTVAQFASFATISYADFPLSLFYSMGFLYMFIWFRQTDRASLPHISDSQARLPDISGGQGQYLAVSVFMAVLAAWTKEDGLLLAIISTAILGLFAVAERRSLDKAAYRKILAFIMIVFFAVGLWALYK